VQSSFDFESNVSVLNAEGLMRDVNKTANARTNINTEAR